MEEITIAPVPGGNFPIPSAIKVSVPQRERSRQQLSCHGDVDGLSDVDSRCSMAAVKRLAIRSVYTVERDWAV